MSAKKEVKNRVRLQLPAAGATPAPPVGSTLGPHGIPLMKFVKEFNDNTLARKGEIVPIEVTIYVDKTFDIIYKTSPVSDLIKKAAKLNKGSRRTGHEVAGSITRAQAEAIARIKMPDLNTIDFEAAVRSVIGSARSMGFNVV